MLFSSRCFVTVIRVEEKNAPGADLLLARPAIFERLGPDLCSRWSFGFGPSFPGTPAVKSEGLRTGAQREKQADDPPEQDTTLKPKPDWLKSIIEGGKHGVVGN
jgi:hypothetical protein